MFKVKNIYTGEYVFTGTWEECYNWIDRKGEYIYTIK